MPRPDERLLAIGVDGAPGGWIAAACFGGRLDEPDAQRRTELMFFPTVEALGEWRSEQMDGAAAAVGIDIPIGLPESVEYRACDREARERLRARRNSVFHPPARYLLAAATNDAGKPPTAKELFARVRELVGERRAAEVASGAKVLGLSQQGAALLPKVAEVDAFLRAERSDDGRLPRQEWLFEVHPELCFLAMNREEPLPAKPTAHGQLQRLDLVRAEFADADERVRAWQDGARYSLLDICDAYAACWSALRFARTNGAQLDRRSQVTPKLRVLGEEQPGRPQVERATGLLMRMVV